MLKKVGKLSLKILLWFIGIFIALDLLIVALIFVPPIQQYALLKVSKLLTNITGGEVTVSKIYLTPFFTLKAKDVAIKDHHYNNMIFASTLKGRINLAKTGKGQVCLSFAELDEGEVVLRKYSGEDNVNIAIWAKGFKKEKKKEQKFKLMFDNIILNDVRVAIILDDKRIYPDDNTIDYGFFELQHIYLNVDDFLVLGPDISCKINSLTLSQYTGFEISSFKGNFRINGQGLTLDSLHFTTPNSTFTGDFAFRYREFSDYSDFVNLINFDTKVKSASVAMKDVIYFAPAIEGMDNQFVFSGYVGGTVNHLQTKNMYVKYLFQTHFAGDFALKNVLDFKNNSSFEVVAKNANINFSELAQFKLPKGKTIALPEITNQITYARLTGKFKGSFTNFNTELIVQTNLGTLSTDIKTTRNNNHLYYSGTIACQELDVGKLLAQQQYFNKLNFKSSLEAEAVNTKNFKDLLASIALKIQGRMTQIDICGYPLKNVGFRGHYKQQQINLALRTRDSLASFVFRGSLNFAQATPIITASLAHVDVKLQEIFSHNPYLMDTDSAKGFDKFIQKIQQTQNLAFLMDSITVSMNGTQFENVNGYVIIDNAKLTNGEKTSRLDWFRMNAINRNNFPRQFQIHSNAFNVSLKTNYDLKDMVAVMNNAAHCYLPEILDKKQSFKFNEEIKSTDSVQFINLDIQLFYSRNFFEFILPKVNISQNTSANIHLGKTREEDVFEFSFPRVSYEGLGRVNNLKLTGKMEEHLFLKLKLLCDSLTVYQKKGDPFTFYEIGINTLCNRKEVQFNSSWRNPKNFSISEKNRLSGLICADTVHGISLKVADSKLFIRESQWQFVGTDNSVSLGNKSFLFNHCILSSTIGKISVNGEISKYSQKGCKILFEDFDISLLNSITSRMRMSFGGEMSLMADISTYHNDFKIEGKTFIKNFIFNEELLGDMFLDAKLLHDGTPQFTGGILSNKKPLNINLSTFTFSDYLSLPNRMIELNGKYYPKEKELRVRADIDTLKLGFLSPFLESFSHIVSGDASGQLDFIMNKDSLYFDGKVKVKSAQLGIEPLNTIYYIYNQDILFNQKGIIFHQIALKDKFNNDATLSGYVHHNKFKDFNIDLNISTPKIFVLNTQKKTDASFYGDGFVSGDISIKGDTKQLNFTSHNIKTLSGSSITFPLSSASTVSSSQGIYFVQSTSNKDFKIEQTKTLSTILNFDFIFEITKDAEVKLDLEPIDGVLRCKTAGKLHLTYNTNTDEMNLDGTLAIVSGKFNMSLKNFFPKEFTIVDGGTISFVGPLTSAQLNVSALYQKTATLNSLNPTFKNYGRTDVCAYLGLSGNLMNPIPKFTFAFPKLNNEEQLSVFAALDTANQQTGIRQFFSFVFLNTFITAQSNITPEGQSLGSGIDFVSGILNSFISNQLKNLNIGVNYVNNQNGINNSSYKEYSMDASVVIKDRIKLRTNFGYAEDRGQATNSSFVGGVDLEFPLNDAETWQMNIFFYNDKPDIDRINPKPQQGGGIAFTYRQEFNNRKDFLESWKIKKKKKKENKENSSNQ